MIDWQRIEDLKGEIGEDAFPEVVELFVEEVDEVVTTLRDSGSVSADQLHFLKGCALNLGFSGLAELCAAQEASSAGEAGPLIDCYIASLARLRENMTMSAA